MHELFSLEATNIVITGGGTGLGKGMAEAYLQQGARVLLVSRREQVLEECVSALAARFGTERVAYVCMDIGSAQSIEQMLPEVWSWGEVDVLVNNAGNAHAADLLTLAPDAWDEMNAVNVKGAWLLSRALVSRVIEARNQGKDERSVSIINMASMLAFAHMKRTGSYGMSKASLIHLTKQMALEWAEYGVRVNAIAPGFIDTDMTSELLQSPLSSTLRERVPVGRFGSVADICGVAVLLASKASSYMTGSIIQVDGGHSMAQAL